MKDDSFKLKQPKNPKDLLGAHDCLSCKIFSLTGCLTLAGYTAYWGMRQQAQYRGVTRLVYLTSCIGLASGLTYLGLKRIFD